MKHNQSITLMQSFLLALSFFMLLTACQKEPLIRFGFDSEFGKSARGLSMMHVNSNEAMITLKGEVIVSSGEVLIELIDPQGNKVFSSRIASPLIQDIDVAYQAVAGTWKLKYQSIQGEGIIKLHLNMLK